MIDYVIRAIFRLLDAKLLYYRKMIDITSENAGYNGHEDVN